jgi:hypothetical protein
MYWHLVCSSSYRMLDLMLSILALVAGGITLELFRPQDADERAEAGRPGAGQVVLTGAEFQPGNPS